MKKAYIYPVSKRIQNAIPNPYIFNFINSLRNYFDFVNRNNPSKSGILNLIGFINKIDYLFLNWIEELPDNKAGYFQTFIFILIIYYCRLTNKKIIWTIHNKQTHYKKNLLIKKYILKLLLKKSDFILTHSSEGLQYASQLSERKLNIRFFHHPLEDNPKGNRETKKDIDILIWGTILRYKGIDKFLLYLKKNKLDKKYKIIIVGKAKSMDYLNEIKLFENPKIRIKNKYIEFNELIQLINRAKIILFPYSKEFVLSSGGLMDSLSLKANIIGPDIAAFKDLKHEGIINTYNNFDELIEIIDREINIKQTNRDKIRKFIENNTWLKFGERLGEWILVAS